MPLYDFICKSCGHKFDTIVKYEEKVNCEKCNSPDTEKQVGYIALYSIEGGNNASTQGRLHRRLDRKD